MSLIVCSVFCSFYFLGLFMFNCSSNFCCSLCQICLYYLLGDSCIKCQLCLFSPVSHELLLVIGPVLCSDLSMLFLRLIIFLKKFSFSGVLILWVHLRWLGKGRLPLWTLQVAIILMVMMMTSCLCLLILLILMKMMTPIMMILLI